MEFDTVVDKWTKSMVGREDVTYGDISNTNDAGRFILVYWVEGEDDYREKEFYANVGNIFEYMYMLDNE